MVRARQGYSSVECWGRIYVHFLVDKSHRSDPLIEKINCDRSALNMCFKKQRLCLTTFIDRKTKTPLFAQQNTTIFKTP
jgi:hypothetical protein